MTLLTNLVITIMFDAEKMAELRAIIAPIKYLSPALSVKYSKWVGIDILVQLTTFRS